MLQPETLIRLENVSAGYDGKTVVSGVDLDIRADTFVALVGPNGGGKTTIVRVLLGQLQPMLGRVERAQSLRIGYLPQVNAIDPSFPINALDTVLSGQQEGSRLRPSAATRQRAAELLDFVQLTDIARRPIGKLSGGQRQRVLLCRALMGNPQLLVLDEPVTYMDHTSETNLYKLLPQLAERMAIVLVSHDIGTISSVVKTIACVDRTLHYHPTNKISTEMLKTFECPVEILSHGTIPHRVLKSHQ